MSFGRPGRCTSPAEMTDVTPPCSPDSMKLSVCWRGVKSPNTGWAWESMSPGSAVAPLGVNRLVEVATGAGAAIKPAADCGDPIVLDQDRVSFGDRRVDVAGDDRADVRDEGPHRIFARASRLPSSI